MLTLTTALFGWYSCYSHLLTPLTHPLPSRKACLLWAHHHFTISYSVRINNIPQQLKMTLVRTVPRFPSRGFTFIQDSKSNKNAAWNGVLGG